MRETDPPISTIVETRWWWVRHAPVPDGGRIYGQRDLAADCSELPVFIGLAAALPQDAVWTTSTLLRTIQTADAIISASGGRHQPKSIVRNAGLVEQHLGDWQGLDRQAFHRERGNDAASFWFSAASERAPNGESFVDLMARVTAAIEGITRANAGRDIIAVTHGGTIRAALGLALGLPPDAVHAFTIDNCALTRIDHVHRTAPAARAVAKWRVQGVNQRPWPQDAGRKASVHA